MNTPNNTPEIHDEFTQKLLDQCKRFWTWFQFNEMVFYHTVKKYGQNPEEMEKQFFRKLSPQLDKFKDNIMYLVGMIENDISELVFTADGITQNIAFVETLVKTAPNIRNWKFVALKPPTPIEHIVIKMNGVEFKADNMFFYENENPNFPDEINLCIVHNNMTERNRDVVTHGVKIFLDNHLGELMFLDTIDNMEVIYKKDAQKELVPIAKLTDFLKWRQKEFIEKYETTQYNTENDEYSIIGNYAVNGNPMVASINKNLLKWDNKASHPWLCTIKFECANTENNQGMPNDEQFALLKKIDTEINILLQDIDGYLNVGRQVSNGEKFVFFACKDFRKPSKVFYEMQKKYANSFVEIEIDIIKDKYWKKFDPFKRVL